MIYPWLIVLCCFLVDAVSLGGRALFLIVILLFEKDLNWSISNLSLVMAVVHICNGIVTPLSGWFVDRFPHHIVIGSGISFLGISYLCISFMVIIFTLINSNVLFNIIIISS
jgi:MFS family permease